MASISRKALILTPMVLAMAASGFAGEKHFKNESSGELIISYMDVNGKVTSIHLGKGLKGKIVVGKDHEFPESIDVIYVNPDHSGNDSIAIVTDENTKNLSSSSYTIDDKGLRPMGR